MNEQPAESVTSRNDAEARQAGRVAAPLIITEITPLAARTDENLRYLLAIMDRLGRDRLPGIGRAEVLDELGKRHA